MDNYNQQEAYRRAEKKVNAIKGFYGGLFGYCIVIPILIYINLTYTPNYYWFWYSAIGGGIGLLVHGMAIFGDFPFLSKDWEKRKIEQLMEKENNKIVKQ
ncbi:2TM domain-containing protein [Flavobacterium litorale]|uniref:2TM domain-containing protein n=2 Tax=Flavobacterium litorale TaxID=2856519 RepID=A0ABX8V9G0_9FLAO|nr:2TM domain-containing protein [Flavobacterium litorale]